MRDGDALVVPFGHQVVRFCLQKNPKERPNCASLLSKKFFKRDLQPDGIVKELLVNVPVVGDGDEALERREPGCVNSVWPLCNLVKYQIEFRNPGSLKISLSYLPYSCLRVGSGTPCVKHVGLQYSLLWDVKEPPQLQTTEMLHTHLALYRLFSVPAAVVVEEQMTLDAKTGKNPKPASSTSAAGEGEGHSREKASGECAKVKLVTEVNFVIQELVCSWNPPRA